MRPSMEMCVCLDEMEAYYSEVINMNSGQEMLTSLLHTVQMGQSGIRVVQPKAVRTDLKQELSEQLKEYDAIEKEALCLAEARGWELSNINPMITQMSRMMARIQLMMGDTDSKIAGMLIQGNTRGIIFGVKHLNRDNQTDEQITQLAQRLLNRENINIQKSQSFL